jgi:hypothetical protein
MESALAADIDNFTTYQTLRIAVIKLKDEGLITEEEMMRILIDLTNKHCPFVVS